MRFLKFYSVKQKNENSGEVFNSTCLPSGNLVDGLPLDLRTKTSKRKGDGNLEMSKPLQLKTKRSCQLFKSFDLLDMVLIPTL